MYDDELEARICDTVDLVRPYIAFRALNGLNAYFENAKVDSSATRKAMELLQRLADLHREDIELVDVKDDGGARCCD